MRSLFPLSSCSVSSVLLLAAILAVLGPARFASAQLTVVSDPDGVGGFKLQGNGITWWSEGVCSEFPSNGSARFRSTLLAPTNTVERDCNTSPQSAQAIRDGAYMYFVRDGQLIRKALNLTETDPNVALDVSPFNPALLDDQGTPLMIFEGHLYWSKYNTGAGLFSMLRIPTEGGPAELVFTTGGARPIEMAARRYDDSTFDGVLGLVWLDQTGTLRVFRDTGSGSSIATLETGVADFDLHAVTFFSLPGGLTRSVSIFAAIGNPTPASTGPPGRLDQIQISNGSTTTLFTPPGIGQVLSVATDSDVFATGEANVYIAEGLVSCSFLCSIFDTTQWRRSIVGSGSLNFVQYLNTGGGRNLESDDQFVYFSIGTLTSGSIRRIASDAPPVQVDFSALGVEIIQNTQSLLQDVPLVAGKRTYARGYPGLPINVGQKANFSISASLAGSRNGSPLPGSPLFSENNVSLDLTQTLAIARGNLANSFLWELPESWTSEGSITVTMTVDPNISLPETESRSNNVVSLASTADFRPPFEPCIIMKSVDVVGGPLWSPDSPNANYGSIAARARSLLPVHDLRSFYNPNALQDQRFEVEWEWLPCFPFMCYVSYIASNYYPFVFPIDQSPNAPDGDSEALDELNWWESTTSDPSGCTDLHWAGAVHPMTPWTWGGLGGVGGLSLLYVATSAPGSAAADFNDALGGRVLAHEIGHNHGRNHINCGGAGGNMDTPPFGVCNFSSSNLTLNSTHFGFDVYTEQPLDPTQSGDLMSYAGTRWISAWNYQNILNDIIAGGSQAITVAAAAASGPQLLIRGHVDDIAPSAQIGMAYLLPVGSYNVDKADRSAAEAFAAESTNDWRLAIVDETGAELARVGVPLRLDTEVDSSTYFAQFVPYPAGAAMVQLLLNDILVAEVIPSDNAPSLSLLPPVVDEIQQTLSVEWTASDPDGDPLHFAIWYSPDGIDWQNLRMDYPGLSATFDTHLLSGSTDGRVRVMATDGFNTAVEESLPFALGDHDPIVIMAGPGEGSHVPFGDRVEFFAAGFDAEDGDIPPDMLNWQVTGAESIADTGDALSLPRLLPGPYLVELTATDTSGRSASDDLLFEVDPLLVPDTSIPTLDGLCGDPAYVNATFVEIPLTSGRFAQVRLMHASGDLYACFTDAERGPVLTSAPVSVGLRVEIDGGGDSLLEPGDLAFMVNDQGLPFQLVPSAEPGNLFVVTADPWPGVTVEVNLNVGGWSAEFQISEAAVGGWDHAASLQLNHIRSGVTPISDTWPTGGDENVPASWAPAYFGTLPVPLGRQPVAMAGPDRQLDPLSPTEVQLDGTGSFDSDGDPITHQWSQTGGPPVQLLNDMAAVASFMASPDDGDAIYLFELVVNDGAQNSAPDSVAVHVNPSQPTPVTSAPGQIIPAFVEVGDPGNLPDPDFGVGAVSYGFHAGTSEVSNIAYVQFLNAVAASDPLAIFSPEMQSNPRGGIIRSGTPGSFSYDVKANMATKPVNFVSWLDAARYVNWVENGAPDAPSGPGVTEDGTYDLSESNPTRNAGAIYVLPSEDEWVKAGHFTGGAASLYNFFTTQSDSDPSSAAASPTGNTLNPSAATVNYMNGAHWNALTGHLVSVASTQATSFYGTYDQGGNVQEWTESLGGGGSLRIVRGGSFRGDVITISIEASGDLPQTTDQDDLGFRVFSTNAVPEPGLGMMLLAGMISLSLRGHHRVATRRAQASNARSFGRRPQG